jgi:hypothetical protein
LGNFRMLNLKHGRAMEYLNLNHSQKMDIITYINWHKTTHHSNLD